MSWQRPNIGSRMNREVHVRFWERAEVKFLRATRQSRRSCHPGVSGSPSQADINQCRGYEYTLEKRRLPAPKIEIGQLFPSDAYTMRRLLRKARSAMSFESII